MILFGGFLVRGTALRRVSARARGFNCVLRGRRGPVFIELWTLLLRGESAEGYGRILLLPAAGMPRSGSMPEKFGVEGDVRFLSLAVHLDVRGGDSK